MAIPIAVLGALGLAGALGLGGASIGLSHQNQKRAQQQMAESASASVLSDRKWAEQQAQKTMDFQERMSNTSWQRGVEDMRAAGINPALAFSQGGASSASGATAQTSATETYAAIQREAMFFNSLNSAMSAMSNIAGRAVSAPKPAQHTHVSTGSRYYMR